MPPGFIADSARPRKVTAASSRPSSAGSMGEGVTSGNQWFQSTSTAGNSPPEPSHQIAAKLSRRSSFGGVTSPNRPQNPPEAFERHQSPPRAESPIKPDPSPGKAPVPPSPASRTDKVSETVLPEMVVIPNLPYPLESSISISTSPSVPCAIPTRPSTSTDTRGSRWRTGSPERIKRHSQEEPMGLSSQSHVSSNANKSTEEIEPSNTHE